MKTPLNTVVVWQLLWQDPWLEARIPAALENTFIKLISALPEILGEELLDSQVTYATLMKARILVLRWGLENGILKKIAKNKRLNQNYYRDLYFGILAEAEKKVEEVTTLIQQSDVGEEVALAYPGLGLTPDFIAKIMKGMTIAEFLMTDPSAILLHNLKA